MGEYQSGDEAIISKHPFSVGSSQIPICETFQKPKKRNTYSETDSSDTPLHPISFFYTFQTSSMTPSMTSSKTAIAAKKKLLYSNEYFECSETIRKGEDVLFYSPKLVENVQYTSHHKSSKKNPTKGSEKKVCDEKAEEKQKRRKAETTPTHTNFLRRKSEGYSKEKSQKKGNNYLLL